MKLLQDMSDQEIKEYEKNLDSDLMQVQEEMKFYLDALLNDVAVTSSDGKIEDGRDQAIVIAKSALKCHDILDKFEAIDELQ